MNSDKLVFLRDQTNQPLALAIKISPFLLWDKQTNSMFFLAQKITTLFWPFDKNESDKLGVPWPLLFGREHLDKNLLSL
jgi:hypothetical protein